MNSKIFDTLLEPTFLINAKKEVLYCNEPASLLCSISARKICRQKMTLDTLFQFSEPLLHLDQLTTVADATPYQELGFSTESAQTGKVQITIQPFAAQEGEDTWLVYFRDVTLEETLQKKYRAELEQKESYIQDLQRARDELKNYSENLEKMVEQRTAEVLRLNRTMTALLNSLSQGFFLFDANGLCLDVTSTACQTTVECDPAGKNIWDVLKLPEKSVVGFKRWMSTLFAEPLPFVDITPLGPQRYTHSEGKHIQLEYYPVRDEQGKIQAVVAVASDITNLVVAKLEAENEKAQSKMYLTLISNKTQSSVFIREERAMLQELAQTLKAAKPEADELFRILHTIKGGAASFNIKGLADMTHHAESHLSHWRTAENVEAKTKYWSELLNACNALPAAFDQFLEQNKTVLGAQCFLNERLIEWPLSQFQKFMEQGLPVTAHAAFMEQFLFAPVQNYFTHFDEVAKQVALQEGKELHPLQFIGADLKVLPEPYENLFNTLVHAYRNAVDHGIETAEVRAELGKPSAGLITTEFKISGGQFVIEVRDDGGGIDPQKIRARLTNKGVVVDHETDQQVIQHVFDGQFSTKDAVTATSGRGVGMDAILAAARALGGNAVVSSVTGQGSTLTVSVPWIQSFAPVLKKVA